MPSTINVSNDCSHRLGEEEGEAHSHSQRKEGGACSHSLREKIKIKRVKFTQLYVYTFQLVY